MFVCQMRISHMFSCSDVKVAFQFAVINSTAANTLKTLKDVRVEFFRKHIFQMEVVDKLDGDLKMTFNSQYGKILSITFYKRFFISNDFLMTF